MLYRLDAGDVYHSKWLIHVKNVLVSCGHMNLWVDQFVARNFCLSKKVKQCCHDSFIEKWEREVFNSPKCLNYRMYKSKFGFEKYLTILPYDLMYILCKFRCCSHRLPIESGRFFSIDRSDRICDLCNLDELGDEFHYLYNCTFFNEERSKFLPKNLIGIRNSLSFYEIMNSQDKYVLVGLAKFCKTVMSLFSAN